MSILKAEFHGNVIIIFRSSFWLCVKNNNKSFEKIIIFKSDNTKVDSEKNNLFRIKKFKRGYYALP